MHNEPTPQPVVLVRLAPDQHRQLLEELRIHTTELRRHSQHLRYLRRNTLILAVFSFVLAVNAAWMIWEYIEVRVSMSRFMGDVPSLQWDPPRRTR